MKTIVPLLLFASACIGQTAEPPLVSFVTRTATLRVASNGALAALVFNATQRDCLAPGQPAPLLSVRVDGRLHQPDHAAWDEPARRLTLHFRAPDIRAVLRAEAETTHVVFELLELQPSNTTDLVLWGPYPTVLSNIIGEVIGVVQDSGWAVGLQALNAKTLGGYPTRENDIEADYTADDSGTYPDLPPELKKDQLFRGDAARRTDFGSVVQAYCRNRDRSRVIENWGHARYVAPAYGDGGVIGSKIALFACPSSRALHTLGAIEILEELPHPLLDGVWAKMATNANSSYLIVDFSEQTIDRAIEMTRRAGLHYLYHSSPFETWGHFKLKPEFFPGGWDGLRRCVEKARKAGVRLGFHTLSNFITPNDPYVTPVPDPRLARIGASVLANGLDDRQTDIAVESPDFFRKKTDMNTVMIGEELIRYGGVSSNAPWHLLECQRGAWGTRPSPHPPGALVAKLMDHAYRVFLTDPDLTTEVAGNIARLCNHAGTLQISLDGLEGAWSTGLGQYGRTLFTKAWYDTLAPELRGQINDASNPGHFNWHIYTRMNWGEPWYAGFRESQTLYRFKNQLHFERNLMPHMLGWFALRPDTSLEDAEWLLARAAGFDAGFALAASVASTAQLAADPNSPDAARQFGAVPGILSAIREWETARMTRAFPPDVRARLRDNSREFHLEPAGPGHWNLAEISVTRLTHNADNPAPTPSQFTNDPPAQALQWTVRSTSKQPVRGVTLRFNNRLAVDLKERALPPGGCLAYRGGATASIYDPAWKEVDRVEVDASASHLDPGSHTMALGCPPQPDTTLKLELRTRGAATPIPSDSGPKPVDRSAAPRS